MKQLFFAGLILGAVMLTGVSQSLAAEVGMVDVGNKFCPLSGDKVSGKHFIEYGGKRYGFCCPQCMKKFNNNPQKYVADLLRVEADKGEAADIAEAHSHEHHDE